MVCLMMVNIILQKICLGELLLTPVYFLKITCNTNALDAQFVVTGIIRVIIAMDCNDSRFESRSKCTLYLSLQCGMDKNKLKEAGFGPYFYNNEMLSS